jgi:hypothetical protein
MSTDNRTTQTAADGPLTCEAFRMMEQAVVNQLEEAGQDFQLGYYAEAAAHLRGAAIILDALAKGPA